MSLNDKDKFIWLMTSENDVCIKISEMITLMIQERDRAVKEQNMKSPESPN